MAPWLVEVERAVAISKYDQVMFDGASFDLEAYFARIGYDGERKPTLRALRAVAFRHTSAIPFENLDVLFGRPIELDAASLQRKLVQGRRGGWCFEHNLLLGHALTALGYAITGLAARVLWELPAGPLRPRSHMLLRVDLDEPYLVDVGFGGLTLTGALRLAGAIEQETPHEPFRLRQDDSGFVMEAFVRRDWRPLYRFDLQPQALADYQVSNWYLSHHPGSHFLSTLIASRVEAGRRYALRNSELSIHHLHADTEHRILTTAEEIREALEQVFHVRMPEGVDMDAALEQFAPAHT